MDNLGDWLYILLLVAAGISGLFSSGKKKNKQKAKPAQPQQSAGFPQDTNPRKGFWEILEEMQDEIPPEPKPRPRKAVPAKAATPKKAAAPTPFLTTESSIHGAKNDQKSPIMFEEVHDEPHTVTREDFHLQDIDEVRKAIIYSEILTRKYQ